MFMALNDISMKFYRARGKNTIQNPLIPTVPGVYFLWSKDELLYIGKTDDLRKRIAQHLGNAFMVRHMVNPNEVKKVSIIFTSNGNKAEELEQQLINLVPTKWNKNPFYKMDWYDDWRFSEGIFAEIKTNDKQKTAHNIVDTKGIS